MEQINQIDRMKSRLDTETRDADGMTEYDRMMAMVEDKDADKKADADKKSAKKDTIDKCDEAMNEIKHLEVAGKVAITKDHAGPTMNSMDWSQTDATFSIECIQTENKEITFNNGKPLEVTLAEVEGGSMEKGGYYSDEADGWSGKYLLPAGTYKITETDYNFVTLDGESHKAVATYNTINADGTKSKKAKGSAIITVGEKQAPLVQFTNVLEPSVTVSVVETFEGENTDPEPLSGVTVKILDGENNLVNDMEWTSAEEACTHTFTGLENNKEYTIVAVPPDKTALGNNAPTYIPDGYDNVYYFADDFTKFKIDAEGNIILINAAGEEENKGTADLQIPFKKIDYYYIPLKTGVSFSYGNPLTNLLDFEKGTTNSTAPLPENFKNPAMIGAIVQFKNADNGDLITGRLSPGSYNVIANSTGDTNEAIYYFGNSVSVTITQKMLTEENFTVAAVTDGGNVTGYTVTITGLIVKEEIFENGPQQPPTLIYDDVTVDTTDELDFEVTEDGTKYIIKALSGDDADNYALPPGGVSGSVVNFPNAGGEGRSQQEPEGERPVNTQPSTPSVIPEPELGCGITGNHAWGPWEKLDGTKHHRVCKNDPTHEETAKHTPSLKCGTDAKCTVCGAQGGDLHTFDMENWKANSEKHWHECTSCGAKKDVAEHKYKNQKVGKDVPQTCLICGYGGFITKIEYDKSFKDNEIPYFLKQAGFDTVKAIEKELKDKAAVTAPGAEGSVLFDAVLMYSEDGGDTWKKADDYHFPEDGMLPVKIEVPRKTSIDTHNYKVYHMFSSKAFGKTPGTIEEPVVAEERDNDGKEYITFYVTGLSPIMVAWEPAANEDGIMTLSDMDGDGIPESDTDGDGIYEGTKDDKRYVQDEDGKVKEVTDPDGDGIYEDKDGKRYIPDRDGDGKPEPDSDGDGMFEGTKDGRKYAPDDDGNIKKVREADLKTYEVVDGELVWITGSTEDLTFTIDAPAEKFRKLFIGGEKVSKGDYSYISGSTIITIDADYLNSLNTGKYDVEAVYTDGNAATTLKVKAAAAAGAAGASDEGTATGDDSNLLLWIMIATAAAAGGVGTLIPRRRKAH